MCRGYIPRRSRQKMQRSCYVLLALDKVGTQKCPRRSLCIYMHGGMGGSTFRSAAARAGLLGSMAELYVPPPQDHFSYVHLSPIQERIPSRA